MNNSNKTNFRGSYNFLQVTPPKSYESGTYLQAIQQDLMTSVFISRIPKQLEDSDMLDLLNVCLFVVLDVLFWLGYFKMIFWLGYFEILL